MRTTARIGLRRLGRGDPLDHAAPQARTLAEPVTGVVPARDELGLDLPAGVDGLADERRALDDERTFVGTRTAAPEQAPQPLDLGVG